MYRVFFGRPTSSSGESLTICHHTPPSCSSKSLSQRKNKESLSDKTLRAETSSIPASLKDGDNGNSPPWLSRQKIAEDKKKLYPIIQTCPKVTISKKPHIKTKRELDGKSSFKAIASKTVQTNAPHYCFNPIPFSISSFTLWTSYFFSATSRERSPIFAARLGSLINRNIACSSSSTLLTDTKKPLSPSTTVSRQP